MPFVLRAFLLTSLGLMVGCGSGSTDLPPAVEFPDDFPPHGGIRINIGGGKGYMEVVTKRASSPVTGEVSLYFYGNDFAPYQPAPDTGVLRLDSKHQVTLEPGEDDALVTPSGPALFSTRSVEGTVVSVELDGEPKNIRIVTAER